MAFPLSQRNPLLVASFFLLWLFLLLFFPSLLCHKENSPKQRHHHRSSTHHSSPPSAHIISVRRANSIHLLELEPLLLHRLLDLLEGNLKTLLVPLVHLLRRDVLCALPVIQKRSQIDPIASRLQNLVNHVDVATLEASQPSKTRR